MYNYETYTQPKAASYSSVNPYATSTASQSCSQLEANLLTSGARLPGTVSASAYYPTMPAHVGTIHPLPTTSSLGMTSSVSGMSVHQLEQGIMRQATPYTTGRATGGFATTSNISAVQSLMETQRQFDQRDGRRTGTGFYSWQDDRTTNRRPNRRQEDQPRPGAYTGGSAAREDDRRRDNNKGYDRDTYDRRDYNNKRGYDDSRDRGYGDKRNNRDRDRGGSRDNWDRDARDNRRGGVGDRTRDRDRDRDRNRTIDSKDNRDRKDTARDPKGGRRDDRTGRQDSRNKREHDNNEQNDKDKKDKTEKPTKKERKREPKKDDEVLEKRKLIHFRRYVHDDRRRHLRNGESLDVEESEGVVPLDDAPVDVLGMSAEEHESIKAQSGEQLEVYQNTDCMPLQLARTKQRQENKPTPRAYPPSEVSPLPSAIISSLPGSNKGRCDRRILDIFSALSPTHDDLKKCRSIIEIVTTCVTEAFDKDARVTPFGSFSTGLVLKSNLSVDLEVALPEGASPTDDQMKKFTAALEENKMQEVKVLESAKFPVVKCTDESTEVGLNVCFNMRDAVRASQLMEAYCQLDKRLVTLGIVTKYWASRRLMNSQFHCSIEDLGSYGLLLLLIRYLQVTDPPILPNLQDIKECRALVKALEDRGRTDIAGDEQDEGPYFQSAYLLRRFGKKNSRSVGSLLENFFKFYMNWDWDKVVSINHPSKAKRDETEEETKGDDTENKKEEKAEEGGDAEKAGDKKETEDDKKEDKKDDTPAADKEKKEEEAPEEEAIIPDLDKEIFNFMKIQDPLFPTKNAAGSVSALKFSEWKWEFTRAYEILHRWQNINQLSELFHEVAPVKVKKDDEEEGEGGEGEGGEGEGEKAGDGGHSAEGEAGDSNKGEASKESKKESVSDDATKADEEPEKKDVPNDTKPDEKVEEKKDEEKKVEEKTDEEAKEEAKVDTQ